MVEAGKDSRTIRIIDLFAGPGGLGEGFSRVTDAAGQRRFALKVSIEKDPMAHRTLKLRAITRHFPEGRLPDAYYDYVAGRINRQTFLEHPSIRAAAEHAASEATLAELGVTSSVEVDARIGQALGQDTDWVLIGGPPCQAYSLAGRSRRTKETREVFESDKRHFLYKEYLRIIRRFRPAVFVMENVKGILTAKLDGEPIFNRILDDLRSPSDDVGYQLRSLVTGCGDTDLSPRDFLIRAEQHGVPQNRHRVIILGIRNDIAAAVPEFATSPGRFTLKFRGAPITVGTVLAGLPRLRSRLSREEDDVNRWLEAVRSYEAGVIGWKDPHSDLILQRMTIASKAAGQGGVGATFVPVRADVSALGEHLISWYHDPRLPGVLNHEARSHMRSDLHRYLFAAAYARVHAASPTLDVFPRGLLPNHGNVGAETVPFGDRFRVQLENQPGSTVVSHIAKDGHYFIHPDPAQCRSLTVREAARIQSFPDNYFFEGNRTEQYTQVGNAVPPLLAWQIAEVVSDIFTLSARR